MTATPTISTTPVLPTREQIVRATQERAERAEQSPYPAFLKAARAFAWAVSAVVAMTALLLLLAFVLRLGGANPNAGFVEWVERSVDRSMNPFRGIFPDRPLSDSSVLDASLLFAAVVYFAIALVVDFGVRSLTARLRREQRRAEDLRAAADRAVEVALAEQHAAERQERAVAVVAPESSADTTFIRVNGSTVR